jgi:hypothetical protein
MRSDRDSVLISAKEEVMKLDIHANLPIMSTEYQQRFEENFKQEMEKVQSRFPQTSILIIAL